MALCRRVRFLYPTLLLGLSLACGRSPKGPAASSQPTAISNRPQSYDRFITIIRLQQPPLLTSLQKQQGQLQIDPEQHRQLLAEQAATLAALRQMSPQIELLYSYKLVVNALAIIAPRSLEAELGRVSGASYVENEAGFRSLQAVKHRSAELPAPTPTELAHLDTSARIAAGRVHHELHITGKGIRVGVIDGGIDYTHTMFGGPGTTAAFQTSTATNAHPPGFPTAKVTGGINLVGSDYDSAAADFSRHIPRPNGNPMDEQGHGTHVAGTIAGRGNGVDTYDGVAPDAELYALKVFGKSGSSGDAVILEALEIAADPTLSLQPSHHLDVVNLSLAEDFGTQHVLYNEAIANLVHGGTVVVAAAGNSGKVPYIVAAPSTAPAAISVAASIDNQRPLDGAERSATDEIIFFSSRGPRTLDGLLKPEIAAPGFDVLSADIGTGHLGTLMSGTSMAAPHVAGVMALLKQAHPELNATELKGFVMGSAVALTGKDGTKPEPLTAMGAGRIDAWAALTSDLTASPAAYSLGELALDQATDRAAVLTLSNRSAQPKSLLLSATAASGLGISLAPTLTLAPHEVKSVAVAFTLAPTATAQELDGFITIAEAGGRTPLRVPVLAMIAPRTRVQAQDLRVHAASAASAAGALTEITLVNHGRLPSSALLFNLLGRATQTPSPKSTLENECALKSAGWRLVQRASETLLQVAVSLVTPVTNWQLCELSLQVDATGSGQATQELLGTHMDTLTGDAEQAGQMHSVLTDAGSMRQLRQSFEQSPPGTPLPSFVVAILDQRDYLAFPHSSVAVLNVDLARLKRTPSGELRLKLGVLGDSSKSAVDTFLNDGEWLVLTERDQAFADLPEDISVAPGQSKTVGFHKGASDQPLIAYLPYNRNEQSLGLNQAPADDQGQILRPVYTP